jgi:hypothetical protein
MSGRKTSRAILTAYFNLICNPGSRRGHEELSGNRDLVRCYRRRDCGHPCCRSNPAASVKRWSPKRGEAARAPQRPISLPAVTLPALLLRSRTRTHFDSAVGQWPSRDVTCRYDTDNISSPARQRCRIRPPGNPALRQLKFTGLAAGRCIRPTLGFGYNGFPQLQPHRRRDPSPAATRAALHKPRALRRPPCQATGQQISRRPERSSEQPGPLWMIVRKMVLFGAGEFSRADQLPAGAYGLPDSRHEAHL